MPTAMFVLLHVAERLQLLHAAGFAHRTLSPSSVLWVAKLNAWRLGHISSIACLGAPQPRGAAGDTSAR